MTEFRHIRPYSGNIGYTQSLLSSARLGLHLELCGLERRLWEEDDAVKALREVLPKIHADLAEIAKFVKEIEDTMTTVEEEQAAAKEARNVA